MLKYILNFFLLVFIFIGCGQEFDEQANIAPKFDTSLTIITVSEKQFNAIDVNATDENNDTLVYTLDGDESVNFNINSITGLVTFKNVPIYEDKQSYTFNIIVSDGKSTDTKSVIINISSETNLIISYATYDDNSTLSTNDDRMFIYFNKSFAYGSVSVLIDENFILEGGGQIGNSSSYSLNSQGDASYMIISLDNNGTPTVKISYDDSNISIAPNTIADTNGTYPRDNNYPSKFEKYDRFAHLPTLNNICINYTDNTSGIDCNDSANVLKTDGFVDKNISRHFNNSIAGEIKDIDTGLIWELNSSIFNYKTSDNYCEGLTLNGVTTWRIPTLEELVSITSKENINPAIVDELNTSIVSFPYYSSNINIKNNNTNWGIDFYDGSIVTIENNKTRIIRCVHE